MRYDKIARSQLRAGELVSARYVGPRADLRGQYALVRLPRKEPTKWSQPETGELMAQFDNWFDVTIRPLTMGWHPFKRSEFKLQPNVADYFAKQRLVEAFVKFGRYYGMPITDKFRAEHPEIVAHWNKQRQFYDYARAVTRGAR